MPRKTAAQGHRLSNGPSSPIEQKQAGNTGTIVFGLAVVFVFLLLAAQYESLVLPLAVILIVPMCLLAAILGVNVMGMDNNILTQIGLVVLIGLAAKNAILIVEFAAQGEEEGLEPARGCRTRRASALRPILMTSIAFILGVLPLVIERGRGRRDAPGAGRRGVLRHDRRDDLRPAVHAGLLRHLPQARRSVGQREIARIGRRNVPRPNRSQRNERLALARRRRCFRPARSGRIIEPPDTPPRRCGAIRRSGHDQGFDRRRPRANGGGCSSDPALDRLVEEALAYNTRYARRGGQPSARAGGRCPRRGQRLPTTEVSGSLYPPARRRNARRLPRRRKRESLDFFTVGFDASMRSICSAAVSRRSRRRAATLDAAQAALDAARIAVAAETARNYAEACGFAAQADGGTRDGTVAGATLELTKRLFDAGRGTMRDVDQARVLAENRRAQVPALEAERRAALYALATLTGRPPAEIDATRAPPGHATLGDDADPGRRRRGAARAPARCAPGRAQAGRRHRPHRRGDGGALSVDPIAGFGFAGRAERRRPAPRRIVQLLARAADQLELSQHRRRPRAGAPGGSERRLHRWPTSTARC